MRAKASVAMSRRLPESLMERLATLEHEHGALEPRQFESQKKRKRAVRAGFGLGFAGSAVAGVIGLLLLVSLHPERAESVLALPGAIAAFTPDWMTPPATKPATETAAVTGQPLEIAVQRSQRTMAPFPLQITGIAEPEQATVLLRNMPERAWLTSGERRDEHTWALRISDLENLHVTLNEGTPDVFNVTIEVALLAGTPAIVTKARVRLLDEFSVAPEQSLPARPAPALGLQATPPPQKHIETPQPADEQPAAGPSHRPAAPGSKTAIAAALQTAAEPTQPTRVQRPEGMSALGALAREPSGESRQLWWKMPLPAWAPFAEASGQ
jgi:hypothetical protein